MTDPVRRYTLTEKRELELRGYEFADFTLVGDNQQMFVVTWYPAPGRPVDPEFVARDFY